MTKFANLLAERNRVNVYGYMLRVHYRNAGAVSTELFSLTLFQSKCTD